MRAVLAGILLAAGACSPTTGGAAPSHAALSAHPVSGLDVIPLTVTSGKAKHVFKVELAVSPRDQQKGMMFRTEMGANEGMLFPMNPPRRASFWMRNTVISLDLIFVGMDGRIINIAANAVPYDESQLEAHGLTKAVLELNGGRAAELGIKPGDQVEW